MELKDKIELAHKQSELIYKKLVVLLAFAGGSGHYAMKLLLEDISVTFSLMFFILLFIAIIGIWINYKRLSEIQNELKELKNG